MLSQKIKIEPLTSARFFAAFYVVLFHTSYASGFVLPHRLQRFIALGGASVSFFFVLSGYILAMVYLRERASIDRRRFWIARFARIYPLFIILLLVDAPYVLLDRALRYGWSTSIWKTSVNFVLEALLLHGWSPAINALNFPSWSLSDEAFFYLLFPVVGLLLWKLRPRHALAAGVALYLGTMSIGILLSRARLSDNVAYDLPLQRSAEFFLGILTCRLQLIAISHPRIKESLYRAAGPLLLTCLALFVTASQYDLPIPNRLLMGIFLAPLYIGIIVALSSDHPGIGRWASHKLLVLLGEASFGLYLIHIPLWHIFHLLHADGGTWPKYLIYVASVVVLSIASFLFLESPARVRILQAAHKNDIEGVLRGSIAQ